MCWLQLEPGLDTAEEKLPNASQHGCLLQLTSGALQLRRCGVPGTLISFCCLQVDFHSIFWHAKELGIDIVRCPVGT